MTDSDGGDPGTNPNNDTLPEGAVSAADAQVLRDTHEAELRSRDEIIAKVNEDGTSVLAAKEAAEARVKEYGDIATKAKEASEALEATLESKDAEITKLTEGALDQRRSYLKTQYKLEDEQVKDLSGPQLDALEKVLPKVSASTLNANNLDLTAIGPGQNGVSPKNPRQSIKEGLAAGS